MTAWLRAAGIDVEYAAYYYFLKALGPKELSQRLFSLLLTRLPVGNRLLRAVDDSPTKRYGPHLQGAGVHHNPTPGPAGQKFLYGHIWVTISLIVRHPLWHTIGLPLLGLMYVRAKDIAKIPVKYHWAFRTRLQLATEQLPKLAEIAKSAGKTVWVVADGAYRKRQFINPLRAANIIVVSRLRKDAHLNDLPPELTKGQRRGRGRPRKYGIYRIHLGRRAACPLG